jgi:nicotinic acid phosphoribosyltransferase
MKELKYFAIIGLLLVVFITNAQKIRYLKTDTYEGVVFPMYWATYPKDVKYCFSPTDKEIAIMEKKLTDKIGNLLSNFEKRERSLNPYDSILHCDIVENLKRFKRQYCGRWNKGDKVIMAQFFLEVPEDWKKIMLIEGEMGGPCIEFRVKYSITRGEFIDFFTDLSRM